MPKRNDPQLRARCVRLVRAYQQEYPTQTAATPAVARQEGVSRESMRHWLAQVEVEDGTRPGVTSEEPGEAKQSKAVNKRATRDNEILRRVSNLLAGEPRAFTGDRRLARRRHRRFNTAAVTVTHDNEILPLAARAVAMRDGHLSDI